MFSRAGGLVNNVSPWLMFIEGLDDIEHARDLQFDRLVF